MTLAIGMTVLTLCGIGLIAGASLWAILKWDILFKIFAFLLMSALIIVAFCLTYNFWSSIL